MRTIKRRWIVAGLIALVSGLAPTLLWLSLTRPPKFYRIAADRPEEQRRADAKRFVAQGLQLRNDIVNEPHWEAAFSDEEVNAWLAEDLMTYFADQVPPGVHEPRIAFEPDRVTLAFGLDEGPIRSVVWVVARVRVPEENTIALTLEKIRAGLVPVPAETIIDRATAHARRRGIDLRWEREDGLPVAVLRYKTDAKRDDVVLERLQLLAGQVRLGGRSNKARGAIAAPSLPTRRVLQSTFPSNRKVQGEDGSPVTLLDSTTRPLR